MQWTADVSVGEWLLGRLDDGPAWGATMHGVVPRGFTAYARIFHRPQVAWVEGAAYPTQDELRETPRGSWPETFTADATWAETAKAFGTELHATAQWNHVMWAAGGDLGAHERRSLIAADGREYNSPEEGRLDAAQLTAIAAHLAAHTSTPDDLYVAVWEGWGGLLGFFGETPARAVVTVSSEDDPALAEHHRAMLERSIHDPFNNVFRKPVWQPGILPDEVSNGARLHLPHRDHVLFTARAAELTDPSWVTRVPWADEHPSWTASPSLVWPADREWTLITEVDYDSTIVAGSVDLIREICADPAIEALEIDEGAALSEDADGVAR